MSDSTMHFGTKPVITHVGLALALLGAGLAGPAQAQDVITFDNLPTPPAINQNYELQFANNNSSLWDGVNFTGGWGITGSQTGDRGDGIPLLDTHSGNYAVTFDYGSTQGLTTEKTLYGLWAGTLQYRDPGAVVTGVTVDALGVNGRVLGSVDGAFYTKTPTFIDTSAFAQLSGIEGYTFAPDLTADTIASGNHGFSLDDLTFSAPTNPVPEASTTLSFGLLLALGLGGMGLTAKKRAAQKKDAA